MARLPIFFLIIALTAAAPMSAQFVGGFGSGATASDFGGSAQLPLTLLHFGAEPADGQVVLHWVTAQEVGTGHFLVERSVDGSSFSPIGRLAATGSSARSVELHYRLVDAAPLAGSSLYRLKSVDLDGSFTYSDLVEVNHDAPESALSFRIHPNPSDGTTIGVNVGELFVDEPLFVEVLDAAGRQLLTYDVHSNPGDYLQLPLRDRLAAGTYFLRLSQAGTGSHTSRLIVGLSR